MNTLFHPLSPCLRNAALAVLMASAGAAPAAVGPAGSLTPGGGLANATYGDAGNVFQLEPMLFVQGLGSADDPDSVVALNSLLQYSFAISGEGSDLLTLDYRIKNTSVTESFNDLRFMVFANPDGDSVNFLDLVTEKWGAQLPGDPSRREGRAFINPIDTVLSSFQQNNNLTEGFDADCLSGPGCDATVGLQWNALALGPGETFLIRFGLSDKGLSLSSRSIDVLAVDSANTVLTLSGISSIVPVPVPPAAWLFGAGLALLSSVKRRRVSLVQTAH